MSNGGPGGRLDEVGPLSFVARRPSDLAGDKGAVGQRAVTGRARPRLEENGGRPRAGVECKKERRKKREIEKGRGSRAAPTKHPQARSPFREEEFIVKTWMADGAGLPKL